MNRLYLRLKKIMTGMIKLFKSPEPSKSCTGLISSGLTDSEKKKVLDTHNQLRQKVASGNETLGNPGPQPPTENMPNLASIIYKFSLMKKKKIDFFFEIIVKIYKRKRYVIKKLIYTLDFRNGTTNSRRLLKYGPVSAIGATTSAEIVVE